jgi:RNA polymerase sigma-70 factor (ECF subfamily)
MNDLNLVELVRESRAGNSQAMEKLVISCRPFAFRLALSILDDPDEADDASQDAMIQAIRAIPSFREEASFQTWFYRIVANNCLGRLRKRRVRERLNLILTEFFRHDREDDPRIDRQAILDDGTKHIIGIINNLDPKYRLPIILRYYHELPIAQVAEILSISQRTVHTRLRLAHDQIRKALGETDAVD